MAVIAKMVMDLKRAKKVSRGESDENQRNYTDKQWANKLLQSSHNYDRSRAHLNFEIANGKIQKIDTSKTIEEKLREMCKSRGMRYPNDPNPRRKAGQDDSKVPMRNVVASFIFEGTRERMHELAFGRYGVVNLRRGADNSHVLRKPEIEHWAMDTYNWVGKKFGYENIAGFYVHLDETIPHVHCKVLPVAMIKGKERVSYNRVFGDPSKLGAKAKWKGFHDSYYAEVASKYGLDRGDDIEITGARHRSYREYLYDLKKELIQKEKAVKGLTTMVENLTNKTYELQNDIAGLEQRKSLANADTAKIQKEIDDKRLKLSEVKNQIDEKEEKLMEAEYDLDCLKEEIDAKGNIKKDLDDSIAENQKRLDEQKQQLADMEAKVKSAETKVKSLNTMVSNLTETANNLNAQIFALNEDIKSTAEDKEEKLKNLEKLKIQLAETQVKLNDKVAKLNDAKEELTSYNTYLDSTRKEVADLEEKKIKLKDGVAKGLGAKLSSWGDKINRAVTDKDEELREEGRKDVMKTMLGITGGWTSNGKSYIPTPEEYAKKYKEHRDKARMAGQLEMSNKALNSQIDKSETERVNAIQLAKKQVADRWQDKTDTLSTIISDIWGTSKAAVNAIISKTEDSSAKWLSLNQAETIFNSLQGWGTDEKERAAGYLMDMASENMHCCQEWIDNTAQEIMNIAQNFTELSVLFAIPAQGNGISSGGGGGNNDLPKKRDDDWRNRVSNILRPYGGFNRRRA